MVNVPPLYPYESGIGMSNRRINQGIYGLWAPVYDLFFRSVSAKSRQQAIGLLGLNPGESLLIPGIGTGLDLPLLPVGLLVTGLDYSPAMLAHACKKCPDNCTLLLHGDARHLPFRSTSFDAVLFSLVLSVVPDPVRAFRESWRVLRPGGRAAIFDKFLPEQSQLTNRRKVIGTLLRALGTDPNRKLSEILIGVPDAKITRDLPTLLHGQYRVLLLEKLAGSLNFGN
jgi:ubiquinone/menaquinone biosynthesis C-methylase UbiE